MSLDDFTTAAQALLAAAGKADAYLIASMTRRGTVDDYYLRATEDKTMPWPETVALASAPSAEQCLAGFAHWLGTSYPLPATVYATAQQKEQLIALYNHPEVTRAEKTKMQLHLPIIREAQAAEMLADGVGSFRQEVRRREAARRGLKMVGSAEMVQPLAA